MSNNISGFHPDTPHVEIKETGTFKGYTPRLTSLDMEKVEGYKNFMPRSSNQSNNNNNENVLNNFDLNDTSPRSRLHSANNSSNGDPQNYDELYNGQGDTAREQGYTARSPKKVVRVAPREKKTFNNYKKYEQMYAEDRKNNVNPLFMSSMCEFDDPWTRECKQRRKAKENFVCKEGKPFIVTPHHASVMQRDNRMAQTSVTARGPYVPPHEAHRRYFFDRRKWLEGPWHIPAPSTLKKIKYVEDF